MWNFHYGNLWELQFQANDYEHNPYNDLILAILFGGLVIVSTGFIVNNEMLSELEVTD